MLMHHGVANVCPLVVAGIGVLHDHGHAIALDCLFYNLQMPVLGFSLHNSHKTLSHQAAGAMKEFVQWVD